MTYNVGNLGLAFGQAKICGWFKPRMKCYSLQNTLFERQYSLVDLIEENEAYTRTN